MVRHITPEGFLTIQTLGGWLDQALINQRWIVMTRNGPIPGLTGIKTVHVMQPEARTQVFKKESMFIDVGAADKDDAEQRLAIRPGDPIAPDSRFQELSGGNLYVGKAWDDRAGVAGLVEVARALRVSRCEPLAATVYLGSHSPGRSRPPRRPHEQLPRHAGYRHQPGIRRRGRLSRHHERRGAGGARQGADGFPPRQLHAPQPSSPRFLCGRRVRTGNPSPIQRLERLRRGRRRDAERRAQARRPSTSPSPPATSTATTASSTATISPTPSASSPRSSAA